jgi:hypothetical protein
MPTVWLCGAPGYPGGACGSGGRTSTRWSSSAATGGAATDDLGRRDRSADHARAAMSASKRRDRIGEVGSSETGLLALLSAVTAGTAFLERATSK